MSKLRAFPYRSAILSFVLFLVVGAIHAVPAIQTPITVTQPDGSQLKILLRGDENFHFNLTTDGYLIQQNESGYYVYSSIDMNNVIEGSAMRVNNVAQRTTAEKTYLTTLPKDRILQALDSEIQLRSSAQSIREKALKSQTKLGGFPTTGVVKSLVILVEFSDNSFTVANPTSAFHNLLNQEGYSKNGATGSSKDYFLENSQGQFHPQFDVYGPVKLPQLMSYYGGNSNGGDRNPARMVVDACNLLKDSIDFSEYDVDKDGFVDNVYVFYAGYGEADGGAANTVWPHKWYVYRGAGITLKLNGVQVDDYACSSELINGRGTTMCGIGTFTHEFSHVLGLPDLYQTNSSSASFTPGSWSILDYGPYNNGQKTPPNYSVYERYSLGWLNPIELDTIPADIVVDSIQNNVGYIIKTDKANEYYLLENRQKSGWDTYIPGHGMLVWHIDYNSSVWSDNTVNNTPTHQYVDIVEADNIKTELTRAGDAFPGTSNVTALTDSSTPNMRTWADSALDKPITDIKETDGKIYFKFRGGVSFQRIAVVADTATNITPVSFVANWKAVENATGYLLDVYELVNDSTQIKYVDGYNSKYVGNVLSYKVDNLQAETEYRYIVRATNGYTKSQASNVIKVLLPEATFESFLPVASVPTAITSSSFTANWEALDRATSYILNVYKTVLGGTTRSVVVDFADKGNLPTGWATNSASFYSSTGYYGADYPALRLESDGRYIESPIFDAPVRSLNFWYRGASSTSGNVLKVEGFNGSAWVVLKDIKSPTNVRDGEMVAFNESDLDGIYAIRIIFIKTGDGAIALDDINVTYGGDLVKKYLPEYTDLNVGNVLSYIVSELEDNTKYHYTVAASNGDLTSRNSQAMSVLTQSSLSINNLEGNKETNVYVTAAEIVLKSDNYASQALQLFSVDGRLLLNESFEGEARISRSNIADGIYMIKVGSKTYKVLLK